MRSSAMIDFDYPFSAVAPLIKIEDSPSPQPRCESAPPAQPDVVLVHPPSTTVPSVVDQDPDGYLKRCSGYNKRTGKRCEKVIGKGTYNSRNGINGNSLYLPTCYSHREQQSFAGRCQYIDRVHGNRCGRLFRWTKPYFELCGEHVGHPDTPCYILKLPLELRLEIFRYLMPHGPIGSSTSHVHQARPTYHIVPHVNGMPPPPPQPIIPTARAALQHQHSSLNLRWSVVSLMLVNHQFYTEGKDLLYGVTPFTIDIRKDGTFMCGRRLLEPKTDVGVSASPSPGADGLTGNFLRNFDFSAVKNYNVEILVENGAPAPMTGPVRRPQTFMQNSWDEEVEIYDIRDYVGVAVSGILSKSQNLCRLNVRIVTTGFTWSDEEVLTKTKCIVEPFMRLRKVLMPKLCGVYEGAPNGSFMLSVPIRNGGPHNLYSVPMLPTDFPRLAPGDPDFDEYKKTWEKTISQTTPPPPKPPIRAMFTELKKFYTQLAEYMDGNLDRIGKHAFLHRARVAREDENVEAFRDVRNELIMYWEQYLKLEEDKRTKMNKKMCDMLDVDSYPSAEDESPRERTSSPEAPGSPDYLEILKCSEEGLGMNGYNTQLLQQQMRLPRGVMQMTQQHSAPLPQHILLQLQQRMVLQQQIQQQHQLQAQLQAQRQQVTQLSHAKQLQQMHQIQQQMKPVAQFGPTQYQTGMQIAQPASHPGTDTISPQQCSVFYNAAASSSSSSSSSSSNSSSTLSPSHASSTSTLQPSTPSPTQNWPNFFNTSHSLDPISQQQIVSQFPPLNSPDFPTPSTSSSDTAAPSPRQLHTPDHLFGSSYQSAKRKADVMDLDGDNAQDFDHKPKLWRGSVIGNSKGKAKAEYIEILDD